MPAFTIKITPNFAESGLDSAKFTLDSANRVKFMVILQILLEAQNLAQILQTMLWWRIMLDFTNIYMRQKIDRAKNALTPALIAGNAPSLAQIEYSRLPLKYDAFRCNQFYFEEKYFVGKDVKVACFADQTLFAQIYTALLLNARNEYRINSVFLNNKRDFGGENAEYEQNMQVLLNSFTQEYFINRVYDGAHSQNIAEFLEWLILNQLYFYKHPTTGILLCAIAVALGHKEIYIAGIDFYQGNNAYAFNSLSQNLLNFDKYMVGFITDIENSQHTESYHSKDFDLACLEFLNKKYGAKFYSLCPKSPLSNYIPLAPITNNTFVSEEKPKDFIADIALPPKEAYMQFFTQDYKTRLDFVPNPTRIKRNLYFRAVQDLRRFYGDFRAFLKYRKELK